MKFVSGPPVKCATCGCPWARTLPTIAVGPIARAPKGYTLTLSDLQLLRQLRIDPEIFEVS